MRFMVESFSAATVIFVAAIAVGEGTPAGQTLANSASGRFTSYIRCLPPVEANGGPGTDLPTHLNGGASRPNRAGHRDR